MPGTSRRKKRNKINSKLSEHQTILNPLLPKKHCQAPKTTKGIRKKKLQNKVESKTVRERDTISYKS
jgi:hypothetical protein